MSIWSSVGKAIAIPSFVLLASSAMFAVDVTGSQQTPARTSNPLDMPSRMSRLAAHGALLDIAQTNGRLIAVGERGHVLLSDDGGANWTQAAMPVSVTLTAVHFADRQTGWAVGHSGVVLRTEDGGSHWTRQTDGRALAAALADALHAAQAAGKSALVNKLQRFIDEGPDKPLLDVLFLDTRRGFAVGAYGLMLATDDGGEHWRVACELLDDEEDRHIYVIRKLGDTLLLAGEQGLLYRSTDGGNSFARLESPAEGSWFGLVGTSDELLLLGLRGALYRSTDGGGHWHRLPVDTKYSFVAGLALGVGKGYLLADDGGGIWHLAGGTTAPRRLDSSVRFPLASLARAADGAVVASGLLGALRIAPGL
ncbi:YCF48-related protein [Metapseudomonas furukawaii]|uniref:WD40/YVTN/BNR-like repeat-containing protein n=1 Tax=Metapseudomonas furukawaii TaxID=1149133 RepID=UPI00227B3A48|nr:YCF48-related protein [Pseudomonas furukawaii]WAG81565.1 YCF48-related protein [Pseudomonas furukawaii]